MIDRLQTLTQQSIHQYERMLIGAAPRHEEARKACTRVVDVTELAWKAVDGVQRVEEGA